MKTQFKLAAVAALALLAAQPAHAYSKEKLTHYAAALLVAHEQCKNITSWSHAEDAIIHMAVTTVSDDDIYAEVKELTAYLTSGNTGYSKDEFCADMLKAHQAP